MLLGQIKSIPRLITTDEYKPYKKAILETYGTEVIPSRTGRPGRPKKPYKVPKNDLLYATVHKHRRRGRVVKVDTNLIYGTKKRLTKALKDSSSSKSVNLSFIERYNGTDRHQNSRKTRKTYAFSKDWDIHNAMSWFSIAYYNFCRPHSSLRIKIKERRYQYRTPAMSAGLANNIWTIEKLISCQLPDI